MSAQISTGPKIVWARDWLSLFRNEVILGILPVSSPHNTPAHPFRTLGRPHRLEVLRHRRFGSQTCSLHSGPLSSRFGGVV